MVGPTSSPTKVSKLKKNEKAWYRGTGVAPDLKTTRNRNYDVLAPVLGGVGKSWHPDN